MRDYEPYYTEDGSVGLYSYAEKDVYHSKFGALTEAWEKFVLPSGINELIRSKSNVNILDVCYGIGYNTKALISSIINTNEKYLKNKSIFMKFIFIVSIYINNLTNKKIKPLSEYIDRIYSNNISSCDFKINIDCLDINEELVKLSPFFKTLKTPEEIFNDIVPSFLSCFDSYYKLKNCFINIASKYIPKNKNDITELLDLKFKNMHIDREYKVNGLVNYIIINSLLRYYGHKILTADLKKVIRSKGNYKFFDKTYLNYAYFNDIIGYKSSYCNFLSTFLHNIYYRHISKRYNNLNFEAVQKLFNLNFYINDARKSIKQINCKYDIIFLDAFTYTKAPQLWSIQFIAELYDKISEDGVLLTYSNSAQIRNTLIQNKFYVGKIYNNKTNKFIGTIASKNKSKILYPLTNFELGLCSTRAGIPYRDPNLSGSNKEILERREYEFKNSRLLSSSKYIKTRKLEVENE